MYLAMEARLGHLALLGLLVPLVRMLRPVSQALGSHLCSPLHSLGTERAEEWVLPWVLHREVAFSFSSWF